MSGSTIRDFTEIADPMLEAARKAAKGKRVDFDSLPEIRGGRAINRVTTEYLDDHKMTDAEGLVLHAIWLGIGQGIEISRAENEPILSEMRGLLFAKKQRSVAEAGLPPSGVGDSAQEGGKGE